MSNPENSNITQGLARSYEALLARLSHIYKTAESHAPLTVYAALEKAAELEHKGEEEFEHLIEEVKNDLRKAESTLQQAGKSLTDWIKFDLELIEDELLDKLTDKTKLEWLKLKQAARDQSGD